MSPDKTRNEAEIEAEIHSTVRHVFKFLAADSLKHQKTFSVQLGRNSFKSSGSGGRLDILVTCDDKNLAVLELKAKGIPLSESDKKQGLSYASLLRPMPPLVVVTNTEEVQYYETFTGENWEAEGASEETVRALFEAASQAAAGDLKEAVGILLGTKADLWQRAIRAMSNETIQSLTGDWEKFNRPFVSDFLIPRQATKSVIDTLKTGSKLVIVEGAPLLGKSNVLRELAIETENSESFVVLFIEASNVGVFQQLANVLHGSLNWPVTAEEVRHWLILLSKQEKPALVLAIDGMRAEHTILKNQIEELISPVFENGVRVVLGIDDAVADSLVKSGRQENSIGRQAERLRLESLSKEELNSLEKVLCSNRIHFYHGYKDCTDYRQPWILRTVLASVFGHQKFEELSATLPPLLGVYLISTARQRFSEFEQRGRYYSIAKAILDQALERSGSVDFLLQSATNFLVQRENLKKYLEYQEIVELVELGCLRRVPSETGQDVYFVGLPELLASELSLVLSKFIANKDSVEVAHQLSSLTMSMPFGDIICAQALIDQTVEQEKIPTDILWQLLQMRPERQELAPGSKITGIYEGRPLDFTVCKNNEIEAVVKGEAIRMKLPQDAKVISSSGWLILSQLSNWPMGGVSEDGEQQYQIDHDLMLEVGTCPFPLVRPSIILNDFSTHDDPETGETYLCHSVGILETVTASILHLLFFAPERAKRWLAKAVEKKSQALLWRIAIALRELRKYAGTDESKFANETYEEIIRPLVESSRWHAGDNQDCSDKSGAGSADAFDFLQKSAESEAMPRLAGSVSLMSYAKLLQMRENLRNSRKNGSGKRNFRK